ncbi:hypothetical protein [Methylorubrum sp. SL192]|uniref:hypothetical protein n=1 Tax=Methylorubrum sp. SL192 TaxID=2995167 RepID=UPI002275783B|nr:hypothetical protein [Methylorubrum sp. SL192]MCY1644768.1 hypothetical protein [Methylorubrum sp. SL192]
MASDKSLAAEIEAAVCSLTCVEQYLIEADFDAAAAAVREASRLLEAQAAEIAALQSRAFEDGARPHVAEALKREAQEQAFRRDLAEWGYASLKERILKAAHMAFAGNDRALRRLVKTIENPVPIQGSAALAEQEKGDA